MLVEQPLRFQVVPQHGGDRGRERRGVALDLLRRLRAEHDACDRRMAQREMQRGGRQRRSRLLARFANPVSLRFPLLDPDTLLRRLLRLAGPLAGGWGIVLWLAVVVPEYCG